jgi:CDP-glucose 4,6-dehydratase
VRSLEANKPLTMRNPNSVRPWQHVLDPLNGYLQYAAAIYSGGPKIASALNFGPQPNDELTVKELVESAISIWGSGTYETPDLKNKVHEAGLLKLDISQSKADLNWQPMLNSSETIQYTIEWYKQPEHNRENFTYNQIDAFYKKVDACN